MHINEFFQLFTPFAAPRNVTLRPFLLLFIFLQMPFSWADNGQGEVSRRLPALSNCELLVNLNSSRNRDRFERVRQRRIRLGQSRTLVRPDLSGPRVSEEELLESVQSALGKDWDSASSTLQVRRTSVAFMREKIWPGTIEVVRQYSETSQDGHVFLRIGDKFVSYWPVRGLAVDDYDYVTTKKPRGYHLEGRVIAVGPEVLSRLYDFFEQTDVDKKGFSMFFNNCSNLVCAALRFANVSAPIWPLSSSPPYATSHIARSNRILFRTIYPD